MRIVFTYSTQTNHSLHYHSAMMVSFLIQSNFLIQRRSAEASASPIDLLMDHQVDFIEDQIDWKWCLLALSGNATIVKLRRNEFVKYLKMNVAAQTGLVFFLHRTQG